MKKLIFLSLLFTSVILAQVGTPVQLNAGAYQLGTGSSWDASLAGHTTPFVLTTVLGNCTVGEVKFLTTSPPSLNLCTSLNTWSPIQTSTSGVVTSFNGRAGVVTLTSADVLTALNLPGGSVVAHTTGPLTFGNTAKFDNVGNLVDSTIIAGQANALVVIAGSPPSNEGALQDNTTSGVTQGYINGIKVTYAAIAQVAAPIGDVICASGSDPLGALWTGMTGGVVTGATTIITPNIQFYEVGQTVVLSQFGDIGFNGNYTVLSTTTTTVTINLNSSSLSYTAAGTPRIALACSNSTDNNNTYIPFSTGYTAPANAFKVAGKTLQLSATFDEWSAASQAGMTTNNIVIRAGAIPVYTSVPSVNAGGIGVWGRNFGSNISFTTTGTPGSAVYVKTGGVGHTLPGSTYSGNTTIQTYLATNSALPFTYGISWTNTGAGGQITYVSGGTFTGTGNCLATASNGTGAGAIWMVHITAGVIDSPIIYSRLPQTNTGSGYASVPTSWALSIPIINPASGITQASSCSGSIVTSGTGTLIGAQGNAFRLTQFEASWKDTPL